MEDKVFLKKLREDLYLLSREAEYQINWLKSVADFDLGVDELALEYYDRFIIVPYKKDVCNFSEQLVERLNTLNKVLTDMSGQQNAGLWTYDALRRSPEWEAVRALAGQCLNLLPNRRQAL